MDWFKKIENWCKLIVWSGFSVILFSSLYVNTSLFFPFIVTKTLAFNISVEIMLVAFLILSFKDSNYKIKITSATILFFLYLIASFVSSFLGDNFYTVFGVIMKEAKVCFCIFICLLS